jgi:nucleoid-associated protein YgaU
MNAQHPPTQGFGQLLVSLASWLLLGCAVWALLICVAAALEATSRGRLRATTWVGCPPALRRCLLAGLGVALVHAPSAAPATIPASRSTEGCGMTGTARQRLPVPARPLGPTHSGASEVVVRPGDTLWHLAETRLPAAAPPAAIADLVERLHHRNREVIGPDPDLIRPGQRLVSPSLPRS